MIGLFLKAFLFMIQAIQVELEPSYILLILELNARDCGCGAAEDHR